MQIRRKIHWAFLPYFFDLQQMIENKEAQYVIPVKLDSVWEEELKPFLKKSAEMENNMPVKTRFTIDIEAFFTLWQWAIDEK